MTPAAKRHSTKTDPLKQAHRQMLAETLTPCPELPRHERAAKREADRALQRWLEETALARTERPATPITTGETA